MRHSLQLRDYGAICRNYGSIGRAANLPANALAARASAKGCPNLYCHGRPPSRPPGLLFWAELASLLLIVLYGHAEALWPRQSTRQKTPLRMAALALCASWRCAPRSASPRSFSLDIGKVPTGWWAVQQHPVLQRVMREDGEAAGRTLACLYVARRSVTPRWGSVSSSPPRSAPGRPWAWRQTGTKPRWFGRRS